MGEHVIKGLLTYFDELYLARWGFKYLFSGKDAKLMKDLLGIYQPEDIKRFMSAFFESHDEFIQGSGFSLSVFRACLPKVIASMQKGARVRQCQYGHEPPCLTHGDCTRKLLAETKLRAVR